MEWIYRRTMQKRRAANLARRDTEKSPCPIVSIGNLTSGGTGKTPAVQWLARLLLDEEWKIGIASRGYGGKLSEAGALVSDGKTVLLGADEAGDEAIAHARALPRAIVSIGADRHRAVEIAVENGAEIVLLDDGFQFWSLPRAFDLVLLDAQNPLGNGHLLPLGRLREEPAALSRADAILLTRAQRATPEQMENSRQELQKWTSAPIFAAHHAPREFVEQKSGEILPLDWIKKQKVKAFAGLADNAQFYEMLASLGASEIVRLKRERGDHHRWQQNDFAWFEVAAQLNAYQSAQFDQLPVVTTEKDAVKLDLAWFGGPLLTLHIGLEIENETGLQLAISSKLWPS